jgi:hypothetical protein
VESNKLTDSILAVNAEALNSIDVEDQTWKVYKAALIYISAGLAVVPLRKGEKLLPSSDTGVNYGSASTNRNTIEKWFNPATGRFAGWNIGLAAGKRGGIFVLDIDQHGDIDGGSVLREFESEYGDLSAPKQSTPSGGSHYIFQWEDNAKSSTSKIGPGIDTRGGNENAYKGHIVCYPSVVNNKAYTWEVGGLVPQVPDWIMEKMGNDWSPKRGYGRGNEEMGTEDIEATIPPDQLGEMLGYIDPNSLSYEQWLRIGQAINSQYPDDQGLEIWNNWSKNGERYKDNECRVRWRGFDPAGAVRAGTIYYFAGKGGWKPKDGDRTAQSSRILQVIERVNEDYGLIMVGGKLRILKENNHPALLTDNKYTLIPVLDFKTYMLNDKVDLGGAKPTPVADLWLGHDARREYPNGLVLAPDDNCPIGAYNTWAGFNVAPIEGPCDLFLRHIKEIICAGNNDHYEWLIDWCADLFQDPANPKGCCVVMRGAEGSGKGTFANTIGEMFGPHYRHLIDDSHLLSNFNAHMIDALFVFADEITWGGNKKTAGKLKGMVTERHLVGERKGIDAVGYRNMIHMAIASNSEWVIPAGSNSRRWFMLDVVDDRTHSAEYFKDIYDELENGGREALLHFFLNKNITSSLTRAPETKALQEQRAMSLQSDTIIAWWTRMVSKEELPIPDMKTEDPLSKEWPIRVRKEDLHESYEQWCMDRKLRAYELIPFCQRLTTLGFDLKGRIKVDGKNMRVARVPTLDIAKRELEKRYNVRIDDNDEES